MRTVTYSILVNREPQGLIHPTRGIDQGDPLSPFLFLLCTKGLHGLIQQVARVGYKGHLPMLQRTRTNPFIVYR